MRKASAGSRRGVLPCLQRHELGFRVGPLQPLLQFCIARRRVFLEELRTQVEKRHIERAFHVSVGGYQVARLQVMGTDTENAGTDLGQTGDGWNTLVANQVAVLACLEQGLGHQVGERGDLRAFEDRHGFLAIQRGNEFAFRERLQLLDRDHADFLALAAQLGSDGFGIVGDGPQSDDHMLGIVAHECLYRIITAAGQLAIFVHCLPDEAWHLVDEVRAVIDQAGLEIRLVLHAASEARIIDVDHGGHQLPRTFFIGIDPLPAPLACEFLRNPCQGVRHQVTRIIRFDLSRPGFRGTHPAPPGCLAECRHACLCRYCCSW